MRRREKMSRANIFSFFSKKKIFKRQGKKREFFFVGFFVVVDVWHNYFCVFFYFFHYLFVFSYVCMQQLTQKNCHCGCVFILFFPSGFYVLGFFKRKFFCFFWFHSFFCLFLFQDFFMFSSFFFLAGRAKIVRS